MGAEEWEDEGGAGDAASRASGTGKDGRAGPQDQAEGAESAIESLRRRRERGSRARKAILCSLVAFLVLATAAFAAYRIAYVTLRDRYHEQAWIRIRTVYERIEKNVILEVHQNKARRNLESTWLGQEAFFVGIFTRTGKTADGRAEILVDVPNLREALNFYDDDIHFEVAQGWKDPGFARGDIVVGRGKVKNFSHFLLRLDGMEIRPAGPLERHFYKEWAADLSLVREPIGMKAFLEDE